MFRKIILLLFFAIITLAHLSAVSSHPNKIESNYKIRRISPDGGLSINGQRDVRQDKWGFIWVTTVNNLYRFDGYTFKPYTEKINKTIPFTSLTFERLEIDKEGDLYVTTSNGLLKYNSLTDNFDRLQPGRCSLIKEDMKGRLWISNPSSIGLFDRETFRFTAIKSETGDIPDISGICTQHNKIYIGTATGKIYLYDETGNRFQEVLHIPEYNIADIIQADSLLYALTESKGLVVISTNSYQPIKQYDFFYPAGDTRVSARALFIDKFNHIWITGQRGIYILNPETDEFTHYSYEKTDPYGLPSNSIWRIAEDTQGCLWFGTYSGGLCFINLDEQKSLKSFNGRTDDLSYSVVSSFAEDEKFLWIGTEGGGLNRYNKQTGSFTHFKYSPTENSLSYDNIQSLLYTDNKLWIGMSRGGLDCLDTRNEHFTHYTLNNNMLINDHVERIVAEADSGLWIKYLMNRDFLTYLSIKDNMTEHINFLAPPIQSNGNISDIRRGNGDTLWIASAYQLLIMNVRTHHVQVADYRYSDIKNPKGMNIQTIYVDNDKHSIWIGTHGNGLLIYDIPNRSLSLKADLSKYKVHSIYSINKDNEGNIWLGTDNGLFRMDIKTNRLQQFNKADGAQGQTYYPFSTFKSTNGELYFGGNEGFSIISPSKISYNNYKPTVILSDFLLDNILVIPNTKNSPLKSSIFQTKELVLDYNQNNFSFEFTSTNYLNPGKNRFRYRLEKYDDKWIETDASHRSVSYSKVPKGTYNFEIMTANNDGVWGELTSLKIIIKPAPWLSNWAIVAYILLVLLILYALIRYYNYQRKLKMYYYLEEREREQKEEYHQAQLTFFTNVSHDFRTPLSLILAALEPIKAGNLAGKYISILENNAKRLLALVNEVMDFRSLQNNKIKLNIQIGNWNQFVSDNCSDFSESAEQKRIRYTVEQDPSIAANYYFDKKIMEKILLNLLNNAFKYTPEGGYIKVETLSDIRNFTSTHANKIIIQSGNETRNLFGLVISDSGVGISEASIRHIFERYYRVSESSGTQHLGSGIGLALVKSLVELHKGYIAVYSERDLGSDIVIGFPDDASVYEANDFHNNNKADPHNPESKLDNNSKFMDHEISPITPPLPDSKKKNILFAEDNNDLRELLSETLREYYNVEEVVNGREALELLANKNIDLVLTDIMMPGINGIELSKKIKENIDSSHIPVVILTAKTGDENQIEGLYSGADIYLKKPVNKQILLLSLSNLFKQQARIREYYAKHYFAQTNNTDTSINKRDAKFMKQLTEVIEKNLSNADIDVLQIASTLAMSRRTLYSKVKALTGQSVVEFIRNYRLRKAAQILAEEDISISMVMDRVGIDNASYFSRIFKKEFGESPSEFVFRHHKKSDEE